MNQATSPDPSSGASHHLLPQGEKERAALVIGYGSIGKRHADVLKRNGFTVSIVSRREIAGERRFAEIAEAVAQTGPDLVVICTETSAHRAGLAALDACGFAGPVLVEKPLFEPDDPPFASTRIRASTAYVLRFHPVVAALKTALVGKRVFSAEIRCGSYLPGWRPSQDYRTTESASRAKGGGVLRDLSHELDYALWLFGPARRVAALGGRFSDLEIETDDVIALIAETALCPALSLQLNYLDRPTGRSAIVNTDAGTFHADLAAGSLTLNGEPILSAAPFDRDKAFAEQHEDAFRDPPRRLATLEDGMAAIRLIAAIDRAIETSNWVTP
jgi:predicted dehydrogenase